MTETQHESGSGGQGPRGQQGSPGPRVSGAQARDVNRLRRSVTDRKIAGVAGGIGRHLDIDPTLVRVLLVVLAFFGGSGLLIYAAVWLFVPEEGSDRAPISAGAETRTVVLTAVLVVAALLLLGDAWWFTTDSGWPAPVLPILLLALGVWLVVRSRRPRAGAAAPPHQAPLATPPGQTEYADQPVYGPPPPPGSPPPHAGGPPYQPPYQPPRPPRGRSLFGVTMAVVLLALGVVATVDLAGVALPWAAYPAAALAVVGLALLTGAFVGRVTGLTFVGLLAAAVLAVAAWSPQLRFGDVVRQPTTAAQLQDSYSYTAGRVHLDLTDISDLENLDGRVLDVNMFAGDVVVEIPADRLDVDVVSEARGGQLVVLGHTAEGPRIVNNQSTPDTPAPDLRINLDLGFGHGRVSTS